MSADGSFDATAGLLDGHADPDDVEELAAEQALRPARPWRSSPASPRSASSSP